MLYFQKRDVRVKTLDSAKERYQAYLLRKQIFCDHLQWVPSKNERIETDIYDGHAILMGALDQQDNVVGTVRIIPAGRPMMIEKNFVSLIAASHRIKKEPNTIEISRLCVCQYMSTRKRLSIGNALYSAIYNWSILHKTRYLYMVVEQKMLRNLNLKGYPCRQIGPLLTLPGGVMTVAALLDWREYDRMPQSTVPTGMHFKPGNMPHLRESGPGYSKQRSDFIFEPKPLPTAHTVR